MQPISAVDPGAVQSPRSAAGVKEPLKALRPEEEGRGRPQKPVTDEYVPEAKQEPSGRYWLGKDEDGQPKIYFDAPERAADAPQKQGGLPDAPDADKDVDGPDKKASDDRAESCTCNTDKVDREIEELKKRQEELKRQIDSETDGTKIRELEKQLARIESELSQKDNDTYRRQHAVFSYGNLQNC